jgi:transposase
MKAPQIAKIVGMNDQSVRIWVKRFNAEGLAGLYDEPRIGAPAQVTEEYEQRLIKSARMRPRSLVLLYSLWTLQRLADFRSKKVGCVFRL